MSQSGAFVFGLTSLQGIITIFSITREADNSVYTYGRNKTHMQRVQIRYPEI